MKDFLRMSTFGLIFISPFVLLIVSGSMFFPFITGKNFAFRIIVEVMFASWLLLALYEPVYRPRLSYILYSILGLVGVMFVANLLGESPHKSFWSNYERMEGWVTLLHFLLYFVVLSSVLTTEKLWNRFLNTTLVVAVIMSFFALAQMADVYEVSQGTSWRVDGRFGNSSYLGVYMLFHIFIAAWLWLRAKSSPHKWTYVGLIVFFTFILSQTGTRGAMYGLIGGSIMTFFYLALMSPKGALVKRWSLAGLLVFVLLVAGVWVARDTEFVKNNPALNRFASTTLAEGNIRFTVWQMALEGVKESPVLGWGQENFSYVFNKYYNPSLYGAEPWYDRTHNIFLDWLIAGGALGLLAYLLILISALWYSVLKPFYQKLKGHKFAESFSVSEQALILGLLAAYMFQNLFVFDNIGSWIFYAVVLALIHSRVSTKWSTVLDWKIDIDVWHRIAVPSVVVGLLAVIYFVNVPSISVAQSIIDVYRATSVSERMDIYEEAYGRGFANQEVFEQFSQVGAQIVSNANVSEADKARVVSIFEDMRNDIISRKPNDARLHIIAANFYRINGDLNKAMDDLDLAEKLSPTKQSIKEDQGLVYIMAGRPAEALDRFEASYQLETSNDRARVKLAAAHLFAEDNESFMSLVGPDELASNSSLRYAYATEPLMVQIAYQKQAYDILESVLEEKVIYLPNDKTAWTNLVAVNVEQGDLEGAVSVLKKAMEEMPELNAEWKAMLKEIEDNY